MLNTFQQSWHGALPWPMIEEEARQEFAKSLKQFIQQDLRRQGGLARRVRPQPRGSRKSGRLIREMSRIRDIINPEWFFITPTGVPDIEQQIRELRLFAKEVMPHFQTA